MNSLQIVFVFYSAIYAYQVYKNFVMHIEISLKIIRKEILHVSLIVLEYWLMVYFRWTSYVRRVFSKCESLFFKHIDSFGLVILTLFLEIALYFHSCFIIVSGSCMCSWIWNAKKHPQAFEQGQNQVPGVEHAGWSLCDTSQKHIPASSHLPTQGLPVPKVGSVDNLQHYLQWYISNPIDTHSFYS